MQVSEALQNAGAAAVTIHGRTMEQRYKRAADWGLVQQAANHLTVPVIGNGDVLTYYEVICMHGGCRFVHAGLLQSAAPCMWPRPCNTVRVINMHAHTLTAMGGKTLTLLSR